MDKKTEKHILNILRQGTLTWHVRREVLIKHRRKRYLGQWKNGREKSVWEYKCHCCNGYFREEEMEVDHIDEVGSFNGNFDDYVRRMFCDITNLQGLCIPCHKVKTSNFNAKLKYKRKSLDML